MDNSIEKKQQINQLHDLTPSSNNSNSNNINNINSNNNNQINNTSNGRPKSLGKNFFSEEKRNSIMKELECIGCKEKIYPNTQDGYELIEFLGEGTEGKVWKAVCLALKTFVAIKIINLIKTDSVLVKDVIKEARLMNANNHVNLIHYHTSFLDKDNSLWLVMDYLAGGSLADIIKYKYPNGLPEYMAITILKCLLKALFYLHHNHKIHRDLKSDNILIGEDGEIELSDFGVCAELERKSMTARKTIVGTPCWMAPEIISEKGYNEKIDIWSLGITAIEFIRGKPPGAELTPNKIFMNLLFGTPPSLQEDNEHGYVTLLYKDFVEKCLTKDPEKRPSASKLLDHKLFKHARKPIEVTNELLQDYIVYKEQYDENESIHSTDVSPIRGSSPSLEQQQQQQQQQQQPQQQQQQLHGSSGGIQLKRSPSDSRLSKSQLLPLSSNGGIMPRAASHPVSLNDLENNHNGIMGNNTMGGDIGSHKSHSGSGLSHSHSGNTSPTNTTSTNIGNHNHHVKSPEKERKKSAPNSNGAHHHGGFFSHIRRHSIAKLFSSPGSTHKPRSADKSPPNEQQQHGEQHHHFHFPFSKHSHHHSDGNQHVETN